MKSIDQVVAQTVHATMSAFYSASAGEPNTPWESLSEPEKRAWEMLAHYLSLGFPPEIVFDMEVQKYLRAGWTPGQSHDPAAKTSPWLIPFHRLDAFLRAETRLIYRVAREARKLAMYTVSSPATRDQGCEEVQPVPRRLGDGLASAGTQNDDDATRQAYAGALVGSK